MDPHSKNLRSVQKLLLAVVFMFGFGFALVPLYNVFCEITGLNGKTGGAYTLAESELSADESRSIKVQFLARANAGMSWKFWPDTGSVTVHPGVPTTVNFFVENPTDRAMVAQAVPSVVPFRAANYLHKTECFCFERQQLAAGEFMEMPVRFIVDQELPEDVSTVTLSYALFDITELAAN